MASSKIRTLWFDLGNVILPFDFTKAYQRIARFGRSVAAEEVRDFVRNHPTLEADCDTGKVHSIALYRMLKRELKLDALTYPEFKKIWNDIFTQNHDVIRLIGRLRKDGYRLVLISNTNKLHFDYIWSRYPVMRLFHTRILSYKAKTRKPEPEIYRLALRSSVGKSDQIFYTDDRADLITAAARRFGVQTHIFKHYAGLASALRRAGVAAAQNS